jgi:hypothetical protein
MTTFRSWIGLTLVAVSAAASARTQAALHPPRCIPDTRIGSSDQTEVTLLRGRRLKGKRVFFRFRMPDVVLVVDYQALDAAIGAFLQRQAPERFPFERNARELLRAATANDIEVDGRQLLRDDPEHRIDYLLGAVLEKGAFEVRQQKKTVLSVYRIDRSSPIAGVRDFLLPTCEILIHQMLWVR